MRAPADKPVTVGNSAGGELRGLEVAGLRKRTAEFTLAADFHVAAGERAALIGRSGVGKTTLLKTLAGLAPLNSDDRGVIRIGGVDVTREPPGRRRVGFIFQDQQLFQALDVLENAVFGLRARGMPRAEAERSGMEWLDRVSLKQKARARVSTLSGGERQRVAWVRALIWQPALLLLDEPFSALDPALRESLRRELRALLDHSPVPLILVSHDERDADAIAQVRLNFRESERGELREVARET